MSGAAANGYAADNGNGDDAWDTDEKLILTYRRTLKFYKENEGKSVQLRYPDKVRLVALTQQAYHGKFAEEKVPPLGAFDVIGKDRRNMWSSLGDMAPSEARRTFVREVTRLMPHLLPYLEAHAAEDAEADRERERRARLQPGENGGESGGEAAAEATARSEAEDAARLAQLERQRQEEQRRQIQDALNAQTFSQFRAYAEQQYPSNPDQQAVLVRQLQEQHYFQYMQQIYQQQMETHASDEISKERQRRNQHQGGGGGDVDGLEGGMAAVRLGGHEDNGGGEEDAEANEASGGGVRSENAAEDEDVDDDDQDCDYVPENYHDENIAAASMWTKREMVEFKDAIRKEGGDAIIKVGHGETVTVRVPTHDEGTALFWEFSTDSYDIAFGLFFEWNKAPEETEVSVHVSDSEDEDLDNDEYLDENGDPESGGGGSATALVEKGPPTSVIVPIYRRDCHQEVYAGTHNYPGPGVYLLKFDNTYSLWRSKTLYYRVYYTK